MFSLHKRLEIKYYEMQSARTNIAHVEDTKIIRILKDA